MEIAILIPLVLISNGTSRYNRQFPVDREQDRPTRRCIYDRQIFTRNEPPLAASNDKTFNGKKYAKLEFFRAAFKSEEIRRNVALLYYYFGGLSDPSDHRALPGPGGGGPALNTGSVAAVATAASVDKV